jgi:hypothetical protein
MVNSLSPRFGNGAQNFVSAHKNEAVAEFERNANFNDELQSNIVTIHDIARA